LALLLKALNQRPSISKNICWCFSYLHEELDKYSSSVYAKNIGYIAGALFKNASRMDI